jgi:SAM-dependent methyltransferase
MPYYESDDLIYRKLQREGKHCWDEQGDPDASFENFLMRPFLEQSLAGLAGGRALEIGCGTGPIACFLASRGWSVRGIDVSATAIAMARQHAEERGLAVGFEVGDICHLPAQPDSYDLIVDGHCLHCLVRDEDRHKALGAVHRLLKPDGLFLVETMVFHPGMGVGERYRLDDRGMLWLRVEEPTGPADAVRWGGEWFIPHRRILPAEAVEAELEAAGLRMQWKRTVPQKGTGKPMLMQVRCTRS